MSVAPSATAARAGGAPARFAVVWLPVAGWILTILGLSSDSFAAEETSRWVTWALEWVYPGADPALAWVLDRLLRKLAHFVEYAVLGALLLRALQTTAVRVPFAVAVTVAAVVAVGDETRQWFTTLRSASLADCALDGCGGVVGAWLWVRVPQWLPRRGARR